MSDDEGMGGQEEQWLQFAQRSKREQTTLQVFLTKKVRPSQRGLMHYLLNCSSGSVERPIVPENGARFNLLSKTNGDAKLDFRFDVSGVLHLFHALRIPRIITLSSGRRFDGLEGLCVMLRRLAYPARLHDLRPLFPGRSVSLLSSVFRHVVDFIIQKFDATSYFAGSLVRRRLADYCAAVHANGAPLDSLFGFIDGTKIEICEPVDIRVVDERRRFQRNPYYSGAKREFCLGFQAVTAPDGTCIHFWGPLPGARHDMALLYYSGLLKFFGDSDDDFFRGRFVYGDLGYGLHRFVMTGYRRQARTVADHQAFNTLMNRQRACVEWNFGRMKTIWAFLNDKHQMKIGSVPVDKFVKVSMFLTNCDNCLNGGNQGSQFFNFPPPTIEEYLGVE